MDLDALHRHMTEFKTMKPRILKALEFVEAIMTSGVMPSTKPTMEPTTDTSSAVVTRDELGTIRQDVTVLDDRIDVLDKFKEDVLPVLDKVPQFIELMEKMQGFDPTSIEERLTAVEGAVQEIGAALDPKGEELPAAAAIGGSDGATPGQAAPQSEASAVGEAGASEAGAAGVKEPAAAPGAPAAS